MCTQIEDNMFVCTLWLELICIYMLGADVHSAAANGRLRIYIGNKRRLVSTRLRPIDAVGGVGGFARNHRRRRRRRRHLVATWVVDLLFTPSTGFALGFVGAAPVCRRIRRRVRQRGHCRGRRSRVGLRCVATQSVAVRTA